jgi:hypothetical protein
VQALPRTGVGGPLNADTSGNASLLAALTLIALGTVTAGTFAVRRVRKQ